ncbi:hypothetical protein TUM22923_18330 [Polynucleobacter sp. TUM22923]|uniref:hypothetical protein n=1 Tax=Polynucleobacter sp. TUM22923 TaxID=3022126 RepID=UPI0025728F45|nr:hypothetical protein [Polynucleobacter sp. TUM22923]BDX22512.1 hypothetical protein TUM22923_18330 [Polynucleobacter sp. TUM22923]
MENKSIDGLISEEQSIDLGKIIQKLALNKGIFLKFAIIGVLGWLLCALIYFFLISPTNHFSIVIAYNFPQAADGKYPNGNPLNPSDILSGGSVETAWKENSLGDKGISLNDFLSGLSVEPYSQTFESADKKYKTLLSQKNLSRADIESIEANYKQEINAAAKQNVQITLSTSSKLDNGTVSKVLNDVVQNWSKQSKEKLGALRGSLSNTELLNPAMKDVAPYEMLSYLNYVTFALGNTIEKMIIDPNSNSLRDSKTDLNLTGVLIRLKELSKYGIEKLESIVVANVPATKTDIDVAVKNIESLKDKQDALTQEAKGYRQSLLDYAGQTSQGREQINGSLNSDRGRYQQDNNTSNVQLSGDAVNKIIDVVQSSKDAQFRQELVLRRMTAENESIKLIEQIRKNERLLSRAKISSGVMSQQFKLEYQQQIDRIWSELGGLLVAVKSIQIQAQKEFIGNSGLLFSTVEPLKVMSPEKTKVKVNIAVMLAIFMLIAFVGATIKSLYGRQ